MAGILGADELGDVVRLELPAMEGPIVGGGTTHSAVHMPTAREIEQLHRQAWEEGLAAGRQEGLKRGMLEIDRKVKQLDKLMTELALPFAELDEEVVGSVAELAILIARHLVRRELKSDPGEIVGVVRETMRQLPVAARYPRLKLHPEDIDVVREALSLGDEERSWRLEADPLLTRGGCVVETETSRIDATVETRLAAIASKMLGGEREADRAR
ncbi:MAG: flagellar assembly protein FliH [Gammaproteobacteria bacterium]|nr:flagellar assembly protein FliH [Gammaproteobacteria bacterium]MBI5615835.1 flagellar assembly protein FliH [Gammaproteobacteria bacterium]